MKIKEAQDKIKEFDVARNWQNDWNMKDLLLNLTEETGEIWNLIKWIDDKDKEKKLQIKIKKRLLILSEILCLLFSNSQIKQMLTLARRYKQL
jgi:NTP pyrophosphatase (non-canonical NTP hydrolase)